MWREEGIYDPETMNAPTPETDPDSIPKYFAFHLG